MQTAALPRIDEHETVVAADVDGVWLALLESMAGAFSGRGATSVARILGCVPATASGPRPLTEGSTIPGFGVTAAAPGRELVLEGRHRFSSYSLIFRLAPVGSGRTRLRAESRGAFPGGLGRAYRLLVVGTRGHVLAVRRLLAAVRRGAERR
jgi:hypothetical protein